MNKPVCLVDMDKTIADLNPRMIERLNQYFDLNLEQSRVYEYFGDHQILTSLITRKQQEEVFSRDSFFLSLDPIEGSQVALKRLSYNFDTYIVTAPWMSAGQPYMDKYNWLREYFPKLANKMIPTPYKHLVYGDILIDDNNTFCKNWKTFWTLKKKKVITASLEYPWTDKEIVDIIASDWKTLAWKIERHFGL